jgi:hypothetical protein
VTVVTLLFWAGHRTGLIDFYYAVAIDNDPLTNPIKIASVQNDGVTLVDGRSIVWDHGGVLSQNEVNPSMMFIELQERDSPRSFNVFYKKPIFYCGFTISIISIPLIPQQVDRWQKAGGDYARLRKSPSPSKP